MSTENKEIIRKLNEGFVENDAEKILSYVADDVRWDMLGTFSHMGKEAFRKELHNENFVGTPTLSYKNAIAEGDYVAVEGEVQCMKKDGSMFDAFFFDMYKLADGKIKEMRSYVIEKNKPVF